MNQLEERRYYEEDDEIDLMELIRTLMKHKYLIVISTLLITVLVTVGGYIYNKVNTINTSIIGFNYPELSQGKNPDGSIFLRTNIIPLDVLNKSYNKYQNEMKFENIDEFKNAISVEGIIPNSTQTLIDNALKRGENISYTPSTYKVTSKKVNKEILLQIIASSVNEYINKYKPYSYIENIDEDIYNNDYNDIYTLLNEKIKLMNMTIDFHKNKNYMSNKLGYSFGMIKERIETLKNVELQDYYSFYNVKGLTEDKNLRVIRINSDIQNLTLENSTLREKAEVLSEMLKNYKPEAKQILIPTLPENGVNIGEINDYYSKLINEYLNVNDKIQQNNFQIRALEENKKNIAEPTVEEKKILKAQLDKIVDKLNEIIRDLNNLNKDYINYTYSDMIKIVSPVTQINEGKPLPLFLGIGIVLGGMLGVFLAFMKEFAKNYRNKYSRK